MKKLILVLSVCLVSITSVCFAEKEVENRPWPPCTIENVKHDHSTDFKDYAAFIEFILINQGPVNSKTVMERTRCFPLLKDASAIIIFEDADFETIEQAIDAMSWNKVTQDLGEFLIYIDSIK